MTKRELMTVSLCPPDYTPPDEAVLDTEHVGILVRVRHTDVCELDVRYWSTEWRVPQMERSFFSSTTTSLPTRDLKNE